MMLDHAEHSEHFGRVMILAVREAIQAEGELPRAVAMFVRDTVNLLPTAESVAVKLEIEHHLSHGHVPYSTDDSVWRPLVDTIEAELRLREDYTRPATKPGHCNTRSPLAAARLEDVIRGGKAYCPHCMAPNVHYRHDGGTTELTCHACHWHSKYPRARFLAAISSSDGGENNA